MKSQEIIKKLRTLSNRKKIEGMARFWNNSKYKLAVSVTTLEKIAKEIGTDHVLAQELWKSGIHEARILAALVDNPEAITKRLADAWLKDLDSWVVCDQLMMKLFYKTTFAYKKAIIWSKRKSELEKRAGFALMASLAFHDKYASDNQFEIFLPLIIEASTDERNFVKKAVNWALRQIGKRNLILNKRAIAVSNEIINKFPESKSAKWIAKDALKELQDEKILKRIQEKGRG